MSLNRIGSLKNPTQSFQSSHLATERLCPSSFHDEALSRTRQNFISEFGRKHYNFLSPDKVIELRKFINEVEDHFPSCERVNKLIEETFKENKQPDSDADERSRSSEVHPFRF